MELATLIGPAKAVEVSESRAAPETIKILFISIGRFPFKARFACDIAEFLSIKQMRGEPAALVALFVGFE